MRSEVETLREQMTAQAGRGWQKLAQDMQRMLKDIGREIEQVEKQIPESLRTAAVTDSESPEPAAAMEEPAQLPKPERAVEEPAQVPQPKSALKKMLKPHAAETAVAAS